MVTATITLSDVIDRLDTLTRAVLANKTTMTAEECSAYIGISKSELYIHGRKEFVTISKALIPQRNQVR